MHVNPIWSSYPKIRIYWRGMRSALLSAILTNILFTTLEEHLTRKVINKDISI